MKIMQPFLKIMIHKDGTKIWMGIYSKTIDSKRYLPFYLNHLKNCLNNISFGLVRRICTIIENSKITKLELEELKTLLMSQKYSNKIVKQGIKKTSIIWMLNILEVLCSKKAKKINK